MAPPYFKKHRPHDCRRAAFHDYRAPGYYMISISKDPDCPVFSRLTGDPRDLSNPPTVILSEVGKIIDHQIHCIEDWHYFKITNYIIMPDHIHIMWYVNQFLDHEIGHFIGLFKSRCSTNLGKSYRARGIGSAPSVFSLKYNDKIAFDTEMLNRLSNYISDNPRRRLIAIKHPHLFQRIQCVQIGNFEMDIYGNFQLLKHPIICPAIVSSRYTPEEKSHWERTWDETIRTQGVLISPFISEAENALMHRAIEEGASVIRIVPDGLPPKFKPQGKFFDLCLEGRCLFIGPARPSRRQHTVSRSECLAYNELARWIASHPADVMTIIDARR